MEVLDTRIIGRENSIAKDPSCVVCNERLNTCKRGCSVLFLSGCLFFFSIESRIDASPGHIVPSGM